jgi:hypothetical protein
LKTDLAVQFVQQAKQVEALIDNLPSKQDVSPIVSSLPSLSFTHTNRLIVVVPCSAICSTSLLLGTRQNDRLKALEVEMRLANQEYKTALEEAGQSPPPSSLSLVTWISQSIIANNLRWTGLKRYRGTGEGGQESVGPDAG